MTIGDRIKLKRKAKDMTLEALASYTKLSRQTLSRYETGIISNIPSDKIELLAMALGTTPAYLMGWEDSFEKEVSTQEITLDDFEFALFGEMRELSDEDKEELLRNAKRLVEAAKWRELNKEP